jgi:prevent-host-death family protein
MVIMDREKASIAHAKNTLSSLINKVAYGKTRVLLESRGKPKAALISAEDLQKLEQLERKKETPEVRFQVLAQAKALRQKIYRRRKKTLSDSARLLERLREQRDRGR